jgi:hypothetical protein
MPVRSPSRVVALLIAALALAVAGFAIGAAGGPASAGRPRPR